MDDLILRLRLQDAPDSIIDMAGKLIEENKQLKEENDLLKKVIVSFMPLVDKNEKADSVSREKYAELEQKYWDAQRTIDRYADNYKKYEDHYNDVKHEAVAGKLKIKHLEYMLKEAQKERDEANDTALYMLGTLKSIDISSLLPKYDHSAERLFEEDKND